MYGPQSHDKNYSTVREAWSTIFRCVDTVAAKQENFAHSLMKEVSLALSDFVKEREVVRKKVWRRLGDWVNIFNTITILKRGKKNRVWKWVGKEKLLIFVSYLQMDKN